AGIGVEDVFLDHRLQRPAGLSHLDVVLPVDPPVRRGLVTVHAVVAIVDRIADRIAPGKRPPGPFRLPAPRAALAVEPAIAPVAGAVVHLVDRLRPAAAPRFRGERLPGPLAGI